MAGALIHSRRWEAAAGPAHLTPSRGPERLGWPGARTCAPSSWAASLQRVSPAVRPPDGGGPRMLSLVLHPQPPSPSSSPSLFPVTFLLSRKLQPGLLPPLTRADSPAVQLPGHQHRAPVGQEAGAASRAGHPHWPAGSSTREQHPAAPPWSTCL